MTRRRKTTKKSTTSFPRVHYVLFFLGLLLGILIYWQRDHIAAFRHFPSFAYRVFLAKVNGTHEGIAQVTDGDSLKINGEKIRLYAIDAPESKQFCLSKGKRRYACGQISTQALQRLVFGQIIRCDAMNKDQYDRTVAVCYLDDGTEINRWMVRNGYAVAYRSISDIYILEEELAHYEQLNLWSESFQMPWKWRKQHH